MGITLLLAQKWRLLTRKVSDPSTNGSFTILGLKETSSTYRRIGATAENIKPDEKGPKLDVILLDKHGINANTVNSPIHFYQLLLHFCDPSKSSIHGEWRWKDAILDQCNRLHQSLRDSGKGMGRRILSCLQAYHCTGHCQVGSSSNSSWCEKR